MVGSLVLGEHERPRTFVSEADAVKPAIHIAFRSPDRPTGAFVLDPDGNNIEAACREEP